jgi:hypothetical protein
VPDELPTRPAQRFVRKNRIAEPAPQVPGLGELPGPDDPEFCDLWPAEGPACIACGMPLGCHAHDCPDGVEETARFQADPNRAAARRRWLGPAYDPIQACLDTAQGFAEAGQHDLARYWLAVAQRVRELVALQGATTPPPPLPPRGETALEYLARHHAITRDAIGQKPRGKPKGDIPPRPRASKPSLFEEPAP